MAFANTWAAPYLDADAFVNSSAIPSTKNVSGPSAALDAALDTLDAARAPSLDALAAALDAFFVKWRPVSNTRCVKRRSIL